MNRRLTRIVLAAGLRLRDCSRSSRPLRPNTATIGSALQHPNTPSICTNCLGVQLGQAGGSSPLSLTSPANGIVTSWTVRTGDIGAVYTLRILHPTGGNTFTSAGSSHRARGSRRNAGQHPEPLDIAADQTGRCDWRGARSHRDRVAPVHEQQTWLTCSGTRTTVPPDGSSVSGCPDSVAMSCCCKATIQFCSVPNVHKFEEGDRQAAARRGPTAASR